MSCKDCSRDCVKELSSKFKSQLRSKHYSYWLIAALLIVIGTIAGHVLGDYKFSIDTRYRIYQYFSQKFDRHPSYPRRTVMVLIGDEEFWSDELARRTPLNRNYLAKLITKLDEANPAVIALDVDLSSPKGSAAYQSYAAETKTFLEAINAVSQSRTIVLATTMRFTDDKTGYIEVPNIYENYDFGKGKVTRGYISLPYDIRQVPLVQTLNNKRPLDSFAVAIARAVDKESIEEAQQLDKGALPYGTFIDPKMFKPYSATHVLETDVETLKSEVAFKIVVIGGAWHKTAFGQGAKNDGHMSPAGDIYGAFIHANYAEALMSSRTYAPVGHAFNIGLDIILSVILALTLSIHTTFGFKLLIVTLFWVVLIGIAIMLWQNLGRFFDFFIPSTLLLSHVVVEKLFE